MLFSNLEEVHWHAGSGWMIRFNGLYENKMNSVDAKKNCRIGRIKGGKKLKRYRLSIQLRIMLIVVRSLIGYVQRRAKEQEEQTRRFKLAADTKAFSSGLKQVAFLGWVRYNAYADRCVLCELQTVTQKRTETRQRAVEKQQEEVQVRCHFPFEQLFHVHVQQHHSPLCCRL